MDRLAQLVSTFKLDGAPARPHGAPIEKPSAGLRLALRLTVTK